MSELQLLRDTLREIRQAIYRELEDTFWISPIETVVDRIDIVLQRCEDDES